MHRPDYAALVSDVGPEQLRALYEDLVVSRRIDTEATALQRQGQLGIWAPLLGQEAAQVGRHARWSATTTSSRATASTPSRTAGASTRT